MCICCKGYRKIYIFLLKGNFSRVTNSTKRCYSVFEIYCSLILQKKALIYHYRNISIFFQKKTLYKNFKSRSPNNLKKQPTVYLKFLDFYKFYKQYLHISMLLPLMSKRFTKSWHVWRTTKLDWIVSRSIIVKKFKNFVLLILGVAFVTLSKYSFPKFQLHVIK